MQATDDRVIGLHDCVEESGGEPIKDGMRWRGALHGLASSAREGRGGHMTIMTTGAVGEARDGGASSPAETAVSGLNISSKHVQKVQVFLSSMRTRRPLPMAYRQSNTRNMKLKRATV